MLLNFDFAFKVSNIIPVLLSMVNKKSYSTTKQWFLSVRDFALVSVYSSRVGPMLYTPRIGFFLIIEKGYFTIMLKSIYSMITASIVVLRKAWVL